MSRRAIRVLRPSDRSSDQIFNKKTGNVRGGKWSDPHATTDAVRGPDGLFSRSFIRRRIISGATTLAFTAHRLHSTFSPPRIGFTRS